jgi:5'(3')-deoxyribonucleotidase
LLKYRRWRKAGMRVFVDLDSTLNNLGDVWIEWANSKYNRNYTVDDILHWDWFKWEFGDDAYSFLTKDIFEQDTVRPKDGSYEFVEKLKVLFGGENVYIISNTPKDFYDSKSKYIHRHYDINKDNIIFTKDKYLYTHNGVLIDDHIDNVVEHCYFNKNIGILYAYKWNDYIENPHVKIDFNKYSKIKHILHRKNNYEDILKFLSECVFDKKKED